jgi:hypothetical protein
MNRRCLILGSIAFAAVEAVPAAAQPQPDQEPLQIVRGIYAPYVADKLPPGKGGLDLIRPHATAELQRLIDRENACKRRTGGLCALDHDIVVDGQDFQIRGLQVVAQDARPGAMRVRASFRNLGKATVVDYAFAITGGRWQMSDVILRKAGEQRLTTILRTNR